MPIEDKDQGADAAGQPSQVHLRSVQSRNDVPVFWKGPAGKNGPEPRDWLAAIIDGSDDAIISKDLNGIIQSWNGGASRLFGYSAEEVVGKSITILIPEDRLDEEPVILSRIQRGERVDHFETRRRRKDGTLVDISLVISPIRNAKGDIVGASKIARDITERRLAEERQELLMGEMRHRVKNLFALASAIVSISARARGSVDDVLRAIQSRLTSLARAHELTLTVKPEDHTGESQTRLLAVIHTILDPYTSDGRIKIEGEDPQVGRKAISNIALILHELATNAAKYGSLSVPEGCLDVRVWSEDDVAHLSWIETNGPQPSLVDGGGFGSRLERGLINALGAEIHRDWKPSGLSVLLSIPLANLRS